MLRMHVLVLRKIHCSVPHTAAVSKLEELILQDSRLWRVCISGMGRPQLKSRFDEQEKKA